MLSVPQTVPGLRPTRAANTCPRGKSVRCPTVRGSGWRVGGSDCPHWEMMYRCAREWMYRIRIRINILRRARLGLWAAALSAPPPETPPCKASPRNHLPSLQLIQVFWVFSERLPQPQHTNGAHTRPSAQVAQKNRAQEHTPHSRAQDKYRLRHSHPTRYPKQRKTSQEG